MMLGFTLMMGMFDIIGTNTEFTAKVFFEQKRDKFVHSMLAVSFAGLRQQRL
jgi:hypothetical protein